MRLTFFAVASSAFCLQLASLFLPIELVSFHPNPIDHSLLSASSTASFALNSVSAAPLVPITIDGTVLRQGTSRW
jgi:hypothetical protein